MNEHICPKCGSEMRAFLKPDEDGQTSKYCYRCLTCDYKSEDKELNKAYYKCWSSGEDV